MQVRVLIIVTYLLSVGKRVTKKAAPAIIQFVEYVLNSSLRRISVGVVLYFLLHTLDSFVLAPEMAEDASEKSRNTPYTCDNDNIRRGRMQQLGRLVLFP